jgi:hypothetical protein
MYRSFERTLYPEGDEADSSETLVRIFRAAWLRVK